MKLASRMCCTVVVLGDSRTGKSALIRRFVSGEFKEDYSPTSFDKSFATQEVEKHQVEFSFWDTSGSPAYDSVRSLTYHEANVFLLCYKISDPISLYNVKNKWIAEIRKHRPDAPVVLCGCQADLRTDVATMSHLGRTGRTPVSLEQALAICCEVGAVHYVETSAKRHDKDCNLEAFDLCALATMKQNKLNNNSNGGSGARRPGLFGGAGGGSISSSGGSSKSQSSTSLLFDQSPSPSQTMEACAALAPFKRSPSTNSSLSLNSLRSAMPPPPPPPPPPSTSARSSLALALRSSVSSLQSPSAGPDVMDFPRCRPVTSPEPNVACRIPPVISENEAYQTPVTMQTFSNTSTTSSSGTSTSSFTRSSSSSSRSRLRPSSVCDPFSPTSEAADVGLPLDCRLQRPTTLFSVSGSSVSLQQHPVPRGSTAFFSPGAESAHRLFLSRAARRCESASVSELGSPTSVCSGSSLIRSPQLDVVPQTNALIRPQFLSRRTSYRTHPKMSIPVATPTSPLGSTVAIFGKEFKNGRLGSSSVTSPLSSSSSSLSFAMSKLDEASTEKESGDSTASPSALALFDPTSKIFESLKSHAGSISEDESSSSSSGSCKVASDLSESSSISCHAGLAPRGHAGDLPDTEDPQLLRNLNFVSPKAGVYRPSQGRKTRANCLLM